MEAKKLKDLKRGEFFTCKPIEYPRESQVYIRGEYDRSIKKYCCLKFNDICDERTFKGDRVVYVGFTF